MVCEHGARAIHKRAVRWRKHSTYTCTCIHVHTRHQRLLPPEERQLAQLLIQWSGCSGCAQVHHCCRLQAQRLTAGNNDYALSTMAIDDICPQQCGPALLSLTVRKNGQPH